jgi:hypothetical protein
MNTKKRQLHIDDLYVRAVAETCDWSKTWGKQSKETREAALQRWHEYAGYWYSNHKSYADSEQGRKMAFGELRKAMLKLRKHPDWIR